MNFRTRPLKAAALLALVAAAAGLSACGSDNDKSSSAKATTLSLSVGQAGKKATYTVPASTKGGLVNVSLANKDKAPHTAQLVRFTGDHTVQQAYKVTASQSDKIPAWIRTEGGVTAAPGQTARATVNLPAGKYLVTDLGGPGSTGPPPYKGFNVTSGKTGDLPSTPTKVTAATAGENKFKWEVSGTLKPGANQITFDSKGEDALHFIGVFRLKQDVSLAQIKKGLGSNGPPPAFVDQKSFYTTAILDGGKSETTPLAFTGGPGTYVLFCPLTDRDGGKTHDQEGLLQKIKVS